MLSHSGGQAQLRPPRAETNELGFPS